MLLGTLGASLLENMLADEEAARGHERPGEFWVKWVKSNSSGWSSGETRVRNNQNRIEFLMLLNFEIQKYPQNKHRFDGVYSRNNLLKIKDRAYVINPHK